MKLSHFTGSAPWVFDPSRTYAQDGSHHNEIGKPNGLWLSADGEDDWAAWCEAEGFRREALAQRHVFEIADPARILRISTVDDLDLFHDMFRDPGARPFAFDSLRWHAAANYHAGVIISPYIWERRLDNNVRWYYGWDCASGCIWDLSAIRFVRSEPYSSPTTIAPTGNVDGER